MKTLTIVGCGKLGKTIGKLLASQKLVRILEVLNRTKESTISAVDFLEQGRVATSYDELAPADIILVGATDDAIPNCAALLAASNAVQAGSVVFHCSGSLPSSVLAPLKVRQAVVASVHPVKGFVDPRLSMASFAGTYCGIEGDAAAIETLAPLFRSIGAEIFTAPREFRLIYHAATIMVSNYVTALLETSLRCYEKAGIDRELAIKLIRPIFLETLENNCRHGPVKALTGPIARGEEELVKRQDEAIATWSRLISNVYRAMGQVALELSAQQDRAPAESLNRIREVLSRPLKPE